MNPRGQGARAAVCHGGPPRRPPPPDAAARLTVRLMTPSGTFSFLISINLYLRELVRDFRWKLLQGDISRSEGKRVQGEVLSPRLTGCVLAATWDISSFHAALQS